MVNCTGGSRVGGVTLTRVGILPNILRHHVGRREVVCQGVSLEDDNRRAEGRVIWKPVALGPRFAGKV